MAPADSSEPAVTPVEIAQVQTPPEPCPMWRRFVAWIVDWTLVLGLIVVFFALWGRTRSELRPSVNSNGRVSSEKALTKVTDLPPVAKGLLLVIVLAYFIGGVAWTGRTLGKLVMRLRVEGASGESPTVASAAIRVAVPFGGGMLTMFGPSSSNYAVGLLYLFLLYLWPLGVFFSISGNPHGHGIHDRAARTEVVSA